MFAPPVTTVEQTATAALKASLGIPPERKVVAYLGLLAPYQGTDRLVMPRHRLIEVGGAVLAAGLLALSAVAWLNVPGWVSVFALLLTGLAMGLGVTTTTVLALELSPMEQHGEASSALQLSDVLGSVLGIAGATAAFAALHEPDHDNPLFGQIFLGLALVALLVVPAGRRIVGGPTLASVREGQRIRT